MCYVYIYVINQVQQSVSMQFRKKEILLVKTCQVDHLQHPIRVIYFSLAYSCYALFIRLAPALRVFKYFDDYLCIK